MTCVRQWRVCSCFPNSWSIFGFLFMAICARIWSVSECSDSAALLRGWWSEEDSPSPLISQCGSAMQHTGINEQLSATASTVGLISLGSTSKLIRDGHGNWWRRQCHRSGRGAFSKTCVILKHWQGWQQKIGNGRRQNGKRVNERASKRERKKEGVGDRGKGVTAQA